MPDNSSPDDLIRDLPRIARYARGNEDADYRFRAYLKGGLDISDAAVDEVAHAISAEVCAGIDCTRCANCCKTLEIVVDSRDINRLARRFGMTTKAFADQYVATADDQTRYFGASPPCPFLGSDNRCSVYDDRPQACRDYPYTHETNFRSRTLSMIENAGSCPIVFNVWDRLKRRFPIPVSRKRRRR